MRIQRMIEGEIIRDRFLKDRFYRGTGWNLTADKYARRVNRLIEKRGDFVESFANEKWSGQIIFNTGDNCLRWRNGQ